MNKIKPSLAKGTRDFGPDEMEIREYVMNIFKDVFNLMVSDLFKHHRLKIPKS